MAVDVTRRRFVEGSAAIGGAAALGGPIAALAARSAEAAPPAAYGYGPLQPTPELDSGEVYLELPPGFKYNFAKTGLNKTEFCGGTFSPDGKTFFLNQQGDREDADGNVTTDPGSTREALTYAIWGPFDLGDG